MEPFLYLAIFLTGLLTGYLFKALTARAEIAALEKANALFTASLKGVAAEALAANNDNFLALAQTAFQKANETAKGELELRQRSIHDALKPLKETLERIEKERTQGFAGLKEMVDLLHTTHRDSARETAKLVNALKAPAVRGRWGEMQLRRVVELAGMLDYCDFEEQVSVATESGRLRPDLIIRLSHDREIVVDAKVSLAAFLSATEQTDEPARQRKLEEHAQQIRTHIKRLSAKAYWDQFTKAPDFVVAFLPGESFFTSALQHDPELIEFGVENRVLIATPTTLIALLKSAAYGWRQQKLAQNAQQISDLGKQLYDRLLTFTTHMEGVRAGLEKSNRAYNDAVGSLETRVLPAARKFKDLSAATGDDLPTVLPAETALRELHVSDSTPSGLVP